MDERLEVRVPSALARRLRAAAGGSGQTVSQLVRDSLAHTRPRPPYSFNGTGASFVRDVWCAEHESGEAARDAEQRLDAFRAWQRDAREQVEFATVTTANAGEIIEPGWEPLLAPLDADAPLLAAATATPITSSTPFALPGNIAEATLDGAAADHTEGAPPNEGTFAVAGGLVTPRSVSGAFTISREIVDSSNPAIDMVAMAVLRESWARKAEARIYTALNELQAGTISGGQVPSGAQVRTSTGAALPDDLGKALAAFGHIRKRRPRFAVASTRPTVAEPLEALDETTGDETAQWRVQGAAVNLSASITGTAAGDGDVFIVGRGDLRAWVSSLLEVRYTEKDGPERIVVTLFGYFATFMLNPRGLAAIRHA